MFKEFNKRFATETQNPAKLLNNLQNQIDSHSSIIIMLGKILNEKDSVQDYLGLKSYLGSQFKQEIIECKFTET